MANGQRNGQRNGHLCPLPGRLLLSARRWARGVLGGHLLPGSLDEQLDSVPGRIVLRWQRRSARDMSGGRILARGRIQLFELLSWHFLQRRRDEQLGGVSEGLVLLRLPTALPARSMLRGQVLQWQRNIKHSDVPTGLVLSGQRGRAGCVRGRDKLVCDRRKQRLSVLDLRSRLGLCRRLGLVHHLPRGVGRRNGRFSVLAMRSWKLLSGGLVVVHGLCSGLCRPIWSDCVHRVPGRHILLFPDHDGGVRQLLKRHLLQRRRDVQHGTMHRGLLLPRGRRCPSSVPSRHLWHFPGREQLDVLQQLRLGHELTRGLDELSAHHRRG